MNVGDQEIVISDRSWPPLHPISLQLRIKVMFDKPHKKPDEKVIRQILTAFGRSRRDPAERDSAYSLLRYAGMTDRSACRVLRACVKSGPPQPRRSASPRPHQ